MASLRAFKERAQRRLLNELRLRAAQGVERWPGLRAALSRVSFELDLLAADGVEADGTYGAGYYGAGRNPLHRQGLSGYEQYSRASSHANQAAYLIWRHFAAAQRTLDVGCALGFVVEALREVGLDAKGTDFSHFAVTHAPPSVRSHLVQGDLSKRLPFEDARFDVVSAFEVLEHLAPSMTTAALAELFRLTRGYLVATIPSFGPNPFGPSGWFEGKVLPERLAHYKSLGPDYTGPVPRADLARDARGELLEGHVTIASFTWWREQFKAAGFVHCPDIEQLMHEDIARFGLSDYWNLYVMRKPDAPASLLASLRAEESLRTVRERWKL